MKDLYFIKEIQETFWGNANLVMLVLGEGVGGRGIGGEILDSRELSYIHPYLHHHQQSVRKQFYIININTLDT